MKLPHALFRLINLVMVTLLRSPLHGFFSKSILALRYRGVKSGRLFTVPARYHRTADGLVLLTSDDTRWWHNFKEVAAAEALIERAWMPVHVQAVRGDPVLAEPIMREMWARHPADAAYMNVRMRDGVPDPADLQRALKTAVVVRIKPGDAASPG